MVFVLNILTFSLLLTSTLCAKFRFYGASQPGGLSSWTAGPVIRTRRSTFCPDDLPQPFTLVCLPARRSSNLVAQFFIDGNLRQTERVFPYTIEGDVPSSGATPWRPGNQVSVKCSLSNGEKVSVDIKFECDGVAITPPPTSRPPSTKPRATDDAPKTAPDSTSGSGTGSSRNCVKIPALRTDTKPSGWVNVGNGLFYKPNDNNQGIAHAGKAIATYSFIAPANGRFGFTLDMETNGVVEHNDVYVRFEPNGFLLTRGNSKELKDGWVKAYHNRNGRQNMVYSVDFDPHSFATRDSLVKGRKYKLMVGGRSTKTGFFSIIMFPCSGNGCSSTSDYWRSTLRKCS